MKMYHLVEAESLWALSQRGAVNLPQVKELQDKLRAAGHDPGASDGWYGKKTADAVRAYQEANGLKVDGDAGPQTLSKLGMGGANNTPPRETPPEETPPAPAPRQPASEPADRPAPATTRREPEQTTTRREPERDEPETPTYNPDTPGRVTHNYPPFVRTEITELFTTEDISNFVITMYVDRNPNGPKNHFPQSRNIMIASLINQGIMRPTQASIVERQTEDWAINAGAMKENDLPLVKKKSNVKTTMGAAGYTLNKILNAVNAGEKNKNKLRTLGKQTRNELIRDGLLRRTAASIHDRMISNLVSWY